jgi:dTDP-4-amino-4,6-dideoxygalactose transaminase
MSERLLTMSGPAAGYAGTASIPFNRFCPIGTELAYVQQAMDQAHVSGDGPFTRKCHRILEELLGAPKVLLTTSCTHALEMAALLLDIQPGDEVIVPSFTFVSTVNGFVLRGARPVFADIRPDTLNLDENLLPGLISPKTKAIVPVHYAGVSCQMETILAVAERNGLTVVEDNAHGLMGQYRGKHLGTFGAMSTLSFHETKNFACGEGGALVINDRRYIERAEIIREKGTNRCSFLRGQIDKYTWVDVGSSYLPSDILAAILYAQLEAREQVQAGRLRIWNYYDDHLKAWAIERGIGVPVVPEGCEHPYHMYYLLMPTVESRQLLIAHLKARNISSVFHYLPLHLSDMGKRFGGRPGDCPVTESVSERLVRLPFYNSLSEAEQVSVVEAVQTFRRS